MGNQAVKLGDIIGELLAMPTEVYRNMGQKKRYMELINMLNSYTPPSPYKLKKIKADNKTDIQPETK